MFGSSNAFGQSSNFGTQTQSVFGQTNNASSNPFGSSTTPCDAQTGSSMFGSNSTGVFGAPQLASFPQTFGISTPAFRASSFAPTSSSFGANSTFGQKSFGLSMPQSTTFGSSSTSFGASSTPAFGPISTSGFGVTSTHGFGASSTPAFGSTNTPTFGASSTSSFDTWSLPVFGTTPTPAFGASGAPAFGPSSTPSFSFGSSFFGSTQSSPFGALGGQGLTTTFWGQEVGSRVMPYASTTDAEKGIAGKIVSISAMDAYKNKTHEELRWEDFYHRGDKGGQLPAPQSPGGVTNSQPSFIFPSPRALDQTYATPPNPFSSLTTPSAQKTPTSYTTKLSSPFGQPTITPSIFVQTNNVSIPSSTGSWNQLSISPSLATNNSPLGQTTTPVGLTPAKTSVDFGCNNFVQPQIATNPTGVTYCETGSLSQSTFEQVPAPANSGVMEPIIVTNPFGTTPPALPQGGNSPSIQYGISSIPVVDKPAPVGISPLLSFRNLSQRRGKARLPTRKYRPADDGPKVPFFQ